jgi:hypothetical protein
MERLHCTNGKVALHQWKVEPHQWKVGLRGRIRVFGGGLIDLIGQEVSHEKRLCNQYGIRSGGGGYFARISPSSP